MIKYQKSFIPDWRNKIVYMPNGGGKTTSASLLKNDLRITEGVYVDLFTRRTIENLIFIGDSKYNEIYFGFDAERIRKRDELSKIISDASPIGKFVKEVYSETNAKKAREKSFYCAVSSASNLKDKPIRYSKPRVASEIDFDNDEVLNELDGCLDPNIYFSGKKINKDVVKNKIISLDWDSDYCIPEEQFEEILDLYCYCILYKVKTCLLCGHEYRSYRTLKNRIDAHFSKLSKMENSSVTNDVLSLSRQIYLKSKVSPILNKLFPLKERTLNACLRDILLYVRLCDLTLYYISKRLLNQKTINNKSVDECATELEKIENEIKNHASNRKRVNSFNNYLIKEINNFIRLPKEISISALEGNYGLSFKIDNKKINPYETFSESEIKRFALVALKAEIHFGKINTLILDDPVDSYDDYNKVICIDYISDICKMSKLISCYILSNDFEAIFRLSKQCKKDVIFYLPDFGTKLGGTDIGGLIRINCDKNDVELISKNEIVFFSKLVGEKQNYLFNYESLLTALILSCRNFNTEVFSKLSRIKIDKSNGSTTVIDSTWQNDVSERIVAKVEHFIPYSSNPTSNSLTITFGEVCDCFARLSKNKKTFPFLNKTDTRLFYDVRKNIAESSFVFGDGYSGVLNYISKKMVIVSHVKFMLEKKLIDKIETEYGTKFAATVVGVKTLGKKITAARIIDKANGNKAESFLETVSDIHEKYSTLYNLFDHGLTEQFSPYLPASNFDINNFYLEVEAL